MTMWFITETCLQLLIMQNDNFKRGMTQKSDSPFLPTCTVILYSAVTWSEIHKEEAGVIRKSGMCITAVAGTTQRSAHPYVTMAACS